MIRVRVTGPSGPVEGVLLSVEGTRRTGPSQELLFRTGASGVTETTDLPPGNYRVLVKGAGPHLRTMLFDPDGSRALEQEVVLTGALEEVSFDLEAAGSLEITVRMPGRRPGESSRLSVARVWEDGIVRELARMPETRRTEQGDLDRITVCGLPPSVYRVRATAPGRLRAHSRTQVDAGRAAPVEHTLLEHAGIVKVVCRGTVDERVGVRRLNLNRWDDPEPGDSAVLDLRPGTERSQASGLRGGRYVGIHWDLRLAVSVTLGEGEEQEIDVTPPAAPPALGGDRQVEVDVRHRGASVRRLFVGLLPESPDPLAAGQWMRFSETWPVARFEGVPAGTYRIVVLDGVFGVTAGLPENLLQRTIEVEAEDLAIAIEY